MKHKKNNSEPIETEDTGSNMTEPFDPGSIKVRFGSIPVYSIAERLRHDEIKLNTEFQRQEGLWEDEQQSRFIESILIRFPVPVFYFDGSNSDEWLVIDGLQRLTTIKRFIVTKELKLVGLEFLKKLEGHGWNELSRPEQRQLNETSFQCHILEEGEEDVKFNIFRRINTGGLSLSDQEIRHAMHQGVAGFLKDLAELEEFKKATQNKIPTERMLDREFVNRFLAFYLFDYEKDYSKSDSLDTFMNRALDELERKDSEVKDDIKYRFKKAMSLSHSIFGDYTFCKSKKRQQINRAIFEIMSVSFGKLNENEITIILNNKDTFKANFYNAIEHKFKHDLTTGGKSSIASRHKIFKEIVNEILNN